MSTSKSVLLTRVGHGSGPFMGWVDRVGSGPYFSLGQVGSNCVGPCWSVWVCYLMVNKVEYKYDDDDDDDNDVVLTVFFILLSFHE